MVEFFTQCLPALRCACCCVHVCMHENKKEKEQYKMTTTTTTKTTLYSEQSNAYMGKQDCKYIRIAMRE